MDKSKKEMTNSHFNMWRLVVNAVHADQRIDKAELEMIKKYLTELDFNEEQLTILKKELHQPASIDEILPAITDPADRSQSVYFIRLLFWKDQILTSSEEAVLKKVQDHFAQFINMDEIKKEMLELKKEEESKSIFDSMPDTPVLRLLKKISKLF